MLSEKHEFIILDEKSTLFQIHHPIQMNLTPYRGTNDQTWIVDARFQGRLRLYIYGYYLKLILRRIEYRNRNCSI